ncbi:ParA family protein [Nautilia lithotrophica]
MIISLYNIKGGVGKTSTSVNLVSVASKKGKTLLWDLDVQGASSYFFNKKPKKRYIFQKPIEKIIKSTQYENIDIIPADTKLEKYKNEMKNLLDVLKERYDFIIMDAPASLNPLTRDLLKHSDIILVPVLPNILSLRTYNQILKTKLAKNIKLFVNGFENKPAHKKIIQTILQLPKSQYLKTYIPKSDLIESMPFEKMSVVERFPQSREAKIYEKMFNELV